MVDPGAKKNDYTQSTPHPTPPPTSMPLALYLLPSIHALRSAFYFVFNVLFVIVIKDGCDKPLSVRLILGIMYYLTDYVTGKCGTKIVWGLTFLFWFLYLALPMLRH